MKEILLIDEKKRIIFHVDMDHFFTAIEERENPEIKKRIRFAAQAVGVTIGE